MCQYLMSLFCFVSCSPWNQRGKGQPNQGESLASRTPQCGQSNKIGQDFSGIIKMVSYSYISLLKKWVVVLCFVYHRNIAQNNRSHCAIHELVYFITRPSSASPRPPVQCTFSVCSQLIENVNLFDKLNSLQYLSRKLELFIQKLNMVLSKD